MERFFPNTQGPPHATTLLCVSASYQTPRFINLQRTHRGNVIKFGNSKVRPCSLGKAPMEYNYYYTYSNSRLLETSFSCFRQDVVYHFCSQTLNIYGLLKRKKGGKPQKRNGHQLPFSCKSPIAMLSVLSNGFTFPVQSS